MMDIKNTSDVWRRISSLPTMRRIVLADDARISEANVITALKGLPTLRQWKL
jgi:hypothetical protein